MPDRSRGAPESTPNVGNPREPARLHGLRERALAALARGEGAIEGLSSGARAEVAALIEALRIYQAELEIQNQELAASQLRADRQHARYAQLLQTMPIPALVVDARGLIVESNALAQTLLRLPGGMLRAHSVFRLLTDRDDGALARLIDRAYAGVAGPLQSEVTLRTAQSHEHPFLAHASSLPALDGEPAQVALLLVDQTRLFALDQAHAQERAQTQRFTAAERAAGVGTWDWDLAGGIAAWDAAALELLGLQPGDSPFDRAFWRTLVHPSDVDAVEASYTDQIRTRDRFEIVARHRRADGGWIWLRTVGKVTARDVTGAPLQATGVLTDVTELQRLQAALEASNHELTLLGTLVDLLQGLRSVAQCGEVLHDELARLFAGAAGRLRLLDDSGQVPRTVTWGAEPAEEGALAALRIPLIADGSRIGEFELFAADAATLEAMRPLAQRVCGSASLALANLQLRERLEHLSNHDPLTSLYNRRFLADALPRAFSQATRDGAQVAVAMIDIDHFKQVNDRFGHAAGDTVLRALARRLAAHREGIDLAVRYGGEEFLLTLYGVDAPTAVRLLEALREDVARGRLGGEDPLPSFTISIGLAMFPAHGRRLEPVVRAADDALYQAKAQGRNRLCVAQG